jgi:hypothetical protein
MDQIDGRGCLPHRLQEPQKGKPTLDSSEMQKFAKLCSPHCFEQDFSAGTTQQPATHVQLVIFHSWVPFPAAAWLLMNLPVITSFPPFFYFVRANSRCRIGRLVDKATADDDAPTPGYLYNDLASASPPLFFFIFPFRCLFRLYCNYSNLNIII